MINCDCCKNIADVKIFFEGMRQGAAMMLGFEKKKNVNTRNSLKFEEMISDINIFEESAIELVGVQVNCENCRHSFKVDNPESNPGLFCCPCLL